MWGLALHQAPHDSISSQNSVLLHKLHHKVCEPQLSDMNTNVAVLLYFMLMMQICSFAGQVKIQFFLSQHVSSLYSVPV
jgi:hypothetical protein